MRLSELVYHAVKAFGYERLAGQLRGVDRDGLPRSYTAMQLRSRTNPQQHAYQLTLDEFEQIVELLPSENGILQQWLASRGYALVPVASRAQADELNHAMSALQAICTQQREQAEFVATVTDALADGEVCANEVRAVRKEAVEAICSVVRLLHHVDGVHRQTRARMDQRMQGA